MKMVMINNCCFCHHCDESVIAEKYDMYCLKAQRQIGREYSDIAIIPPWCPLPDAPEKEVDDTPPGCDGVEILFPGPLPGSLR
jgi:hypothetical protein